MSTDGTPLKRLLARAGIKQRALADAAGMDETLLSLILSGRRWASDTQITKLASALWELLTPIVAENMEETKIILKHHLKRIRKDAIR